MIVKKASIATSDIGKIGIYWNTDDLYADQVATKTGATMVIEGAFFEWDGAVCHLKENGVVKAKPEAYTGSRSYSAYGYQWDTGPDINMALVPGGAVMDNHISCTTAIVDGKRQEPMYYNSDVGGYRQRGAMGIKNRQLVFLATPSGVDMESFRDHLYFVEGWESGIILDGGTKVNVYLNGEVIRGAVKPMYYLYIVPATVTEKQPEKGEATKLSKRVCVDMGHGPWNENGNKSLGYLEYQGMWDIGWKLVAALQRSGVEVAVTRADDNVTKTSYSLQTIVQVSNAFDPDLFISLHSDANADTSMRHLFAITSAGPATAERNLAAQAILASLKAGGITLRLDSPAWSSKYYILNNTNAPAVIIEHGYHTNDYDTLLLLDDSYRTKLAELEAEGICNYLGVAYVAPVQLEQPAEWAAEAWSWAVTAGLLDGTSPQGTVTREMLATVLYRYAQADWR